MPAGDEAGAESGAQQAVQQSAPGNLYDDQWPAQASQGAPQAGWSPLIGPEPSRNCALIGRDHYVFEAIKTQLRKPKAP